MAGILQSSPRRTVEMAVLEPGLSMQSYECGDDKKYEHSSSTRSLAYTPEQDPVATSAADVYK